MLFSASLAVAISLSLIQIVSTDYDPSTFLQSSGERIPQIGNYERFTEDNKYNPKLQVIVYYSKKQCYNCGVKEAIIVENLDRFRGMVDFHRYDCDEEMLRDFTQHQQKVSTCHANYEGRLPSVSFNSPTTSVYFPYDPLTFQQPEVVPDLQDPNQLEEMIAAYMPVFAKRVGSMIQANEFIERFGHLNKALYFGVNEEPPHYFKALSAHFKDRLEVGHAHLVRLRHP